jgi:hypothetical protein
MADITETLKKLGLATARGVPQLATGFVDLAALPFTMTGMLKPEQAVGSTAYLTSKGMLPPEQKGLLGETTELVTSALNPAGAVKGIGLLGATKASKEAMAAIRKMADERVPTDLSWVNNPVTPNPPISTSYRGSHTAPGPEFGAPLHDLTGGGQMYPSDVYSSKAAQYYGTGYPKADKEAFALAQKVRGNPEAEVTIFRAVPNKKNINSINTGDWVTLSKDYAKTHGESVLDNNYKIVEQKVKAKDLWTNADSIHEFGYWPSK